MAAVAAAETLAASPLGAGIGLQSDSASTSGLASYVRYVYHDLWEQVGDPRASQLPMMSGGPWPTIGLVLCYVYFVKVAGPGWMKNRPAFDLRGPIRLYNLVLVLWNLYFFYHFTSLTGFGRATLTCVPPDPTAFDDYWRFNLTLGWWFYISKFVDFVDTVFFVLRKKNSE